jgi:hypothetical protein
MSTTGASLSELSSASGTAAWRLSILEAEVNVLSYAVEQGHEISALWNGTSPPFRIGGDTAGFASLGSIIGWASTATPYCAARVGPRGMAVLADTARLLPAVEPTALPVLALHNALKEEASRSARRLFRALRHVLRAGTLIATHTSEAYRRALEGQKEGTPVHGTARFADMIVAVVFTPWFITFLEGMNTYVHKYLSLYASFSHVPRQNK